MTVSSHALAGRGRRYALRAPRPAATDGSHVQGPGAPRVRYYRAGSAASALGPEISTDCRIAEARAVLVTGVTALLGHGPQAAALALLGAARGLRVVDPNLRRGLPGSDRCAELVLPLIESADLALAGEQELGRADRSGRPPGPGPPLRRSRPARGRRAGDHRLGALAPTASGSSGHPARRRRRCGWRGDAFNAGYLAVRLRGGLVPDALRAGIRCGTAVAMSLGDTAGFPRTIGAPGQPSLTTRPCEATRPDPSWRRPAAETPATTTTKR